MNDSGLLSAFGSVHAALVTNLHQLGEQDEELLQSVVIRFAEAIEFSFPIMNKISIVIDRK